MRFILIALLIILFVFAGCCSLVEDTVGELQTCMSKCSEVCNAVKEGSVDMDGYNSIGLKKVSGGVSVSCECPCS